MEILTCKVSGKEMCSDAFKAEPVEEAPGIIKVQSRNMTEGARRSTRAATRAPRAAARSSTTT